MAFFLPFDPNPFRVNAFTVTKVPVDEVRPREIQAVITARVQDLENGGTGEGQLQLADGRSVSYGQADLNRYQDVLESPALRPREELLVPPQYGTPRIDGAEAFERMYAARQRNADELLVLSPLAVSPLLVDGLPGVPDDVFLAAPALPDLAGAARAVGAIPGDLRVRARDRHA